MPADARRLHLFTDGVDTIVAADLADAEVVRVECHGLNLALNLDALDPDDDDGGPLAPVPDDEEVGVRLAMARDLLVDGCCAGAGYEHVRGCPRGWPVKTAREWAAESGRGLLCSTEV